jgi:hypothetical protein
MNESNNYTIKAGTIVHINGIPVEVRADTPAFTAEGNQALIAEGSGDPHAGAGETAGS